MANRISPSHPSSYPSSYSFTRIIAIIINNASEVPSKASSPLSTALDTFILEASNQAVKNPTSFTTESDSSQYVEYGGKVYLSIDKTASLRKGSELS